MKKPADRQSWLALTAATLVCVTFAARAENARIVYYDVTGSNARALRQQMDAKGPMYGGNQCGADVTCLRKEYAARIQQLQQ